MARGTIRNFNIPVGLKCYRKYGFANGYYRDLKEREKLGLLPSPCSVCKRETLCKQLSLTLTAVDSPSEMLAIYGLNEIAGTTLRIVVDLQKEFTGEFVPVYSENMMESFCEEFKCEGKYGYGSGYCFIETLMLCGICTKQEECFKKFSESSKGKQEPLIGDYIEYMKDGAKDRVAHERENEEKEKK